MKLTNQQKALLIIGGILLTGGLIYLGVRLLRKKPAPADADAGTLPPASRPPAPTTPPPTNSASFFVPMPSVIAAASGWPLKVGSKGALVMQAQTALQKQGFDPRGIDGDFGAGTQTAVKAWQQHKGFPVTGALSSTEFYLLTGSSGTTAAPDYTDLAEKLYAAYDLNLASAVVPLLKQIPNVAGYKAVSERFQAETGGLFSARKTLVNGLFERFGKTTHWKDMQAQFFRMGLVFDVSSGKWGLGIL